MANSLKPHTKFTPTCTATGAYESVQCHPVSRECWCVNNQGVEVIGTRVGPGGDKPVCTGKSIFTYPDGVKERKMEEKQNMSKS